MSEATILTKTDLRARGWTHGQIKSLTNDTVVKTNKKGRPAFGYKLKTVLSAERARVN